MTTMIYNGERFDRHFLTAKNKKSFLIMKQLLYLFNSKKIKDVLFWGKNTYSFWCNRETYLFFKEQLFLMCEADGLIAI